MISALDRLQNYLARRSHSVRELRTKLARYYNADEINEALEKAQDYGWLADEADLSVRVTEELHRKKKGYLFIQRYLREKGLPETPIDPERELEKAREILQNIRSKNEKSKGQLGGKLQARGFLTETIREVLYERS